MDLPRRRLRTLHLFAGAGGGILADVLLGHCPVCAVEIDPYCRRVLLARQQDGCLPRFPIWDDVTTFDGDPWRGSVDIVAGGFPCQDISAAGKGAGIDGARSGLWVEMARIVREVRPRFVFVENSPVLTSRGLDVVLGDLAALGFDARWGVLGAVDAGAPHKRERIWIVAVADAASSRRYVFGLQEQRSGNTQRAAIRTGAENGRSKNQRWGKDPAVISGAWWDAEPALGRVAHGVADRVDRLRAIGNGQVPAVAALAWRSV